jgi:hypothetical protein
LPIQFAANVLGLSGRKGIAIIPEEGNVGSFHCEVYPMLGDIRFHPHRGRQDFTNKRELFVDRKKNENEGII